MTRPRDETRKPSKKHHALEALVAPARASVPAAIRLALRAGRREVGAHRAAARAAVGRDARAHGALRGAVPGALRLRRDEVRVGRHGPRGRTGSHGAHGGHGSGSWSHGSCSWGHGLRAWGHAAGGPRAVGARVERVDAPRDRRRYQWGRAVPVDLRAGRYVRATPAAEGVLALRGVLFIIPPPEALLAELDLVLVGLLTLPLDLGVVRVALLTALAALADAGEEQGSEQDGAGSAGGSVDSDLAAGGEVVPLLGEGQRGRGVQLVLDGGVATVRLSVRSTVWDHGSLTRWS